MARDISLDKGYTPEYCLLEANSRLDLSRDVNAWMGDGWTPQGGVSVAMLLDSAEPVYTQAMVRGV